MDSRDVPESSIDKKSRSMVFSEGLEDFAWTPKPDLRSEASALQKENRWLRGRIEALEVSTRDLRNLLCSTEIATIFLDRELRLRRFTPVVTRLFHLATEDVGRPIDAIAEKTCDPTLPVDIQQVLETLEPHEREVAMGGRWYLRRIRPYRNEDRRIEGVVVFFSDVTQLKEIQRQLHEVTQNLGERVLERTLQLELVRSVAVIANRADSIEEAIREALDLLCRACAWQVGHAYFLVPGTDELWPSGIWRWEDGPDIRHFQEATCQARFVSGEGLIGHVHESGAPIWVEDLHAEPRFIRRREGLRSLRGALFLPVPLESEVVAVLELYAEMTRPCHEDLLEAARSVGIELSQVFARHRRDLDVARSEALERRRIGRDMHDQLGQQLTATGMLAATLHQRLTGTGESSLADELVKAVATAKSDVRRLVRGLLPVAVDTEGLAAALQRLAEECQRAGRISCSFEGGGIVEDNFTATHLFRIAQEAVQNALKHSAGAHIAIRLQTDRQVRLTVQDDGMGFDVRSRSTGSGLRIMRYRAALLGAQIDIRSEPGEGTRIACIVEPAAGPARSRKQSDSESRAAQAERPQLPTA